jgi:hypothetical protein
MSPHLEVAKRPHLVVVVAAEHDLPLAVPAAVVVATHLRLAAAAVLPRLVVAVAAVLPRYDCFQKRVGS